MSEHTEYRTKLAALLEGYGMDKIDQMLLLGGIINELQRDSNIEIGLLNSRINRLERAVVAYGEFIKAIEALSDDGHS